MYITERAIMDTFIELLEQKPYRQITIKNITEACHINRNTFYYYFENIDDLATRIVHEELDDLFSAMDKFDNPIDYLTPIGERFVSKKKAILHIYHSMAKDEFIHELQRLARYAIGRYIEATKENIQLSDEDTEIIVRMYSAVTVGMLLDWMEADLSYDLLKDFSRFTELLEGSVNRAFLRSNPAAAPQGETGKKFS